MLSWFTLVKHFSGLHMHLFGRKRLAISGENQR